ncbi:MAG: YpdA family putative bacillithiol disulfide reductase [candidate division KSB1 bacterium]|nr:YpdA family putative bacillithiol disulfide reductase [candidate division KSB1 bacterium]MDZ7272693.1 YpdA family putative bacillithiol disulfide reductase [candidate division KSB1 bacterium]MDZ7284284.1 YpdA family putative bacillithiol disulfide reductase [candidate division KSB1 bacterium]MDZ7297320.1 YpdA family putative bacillithiol disulfide reductase [candidate division KSB1 bacterium]MDZ7308388.1 YpdA family putative bacillithiol disulfide reductase [candidate division KSB1 bacterium
MDRKSPVDVLIVGAGPVGLACGIAAQRSGLSALIVEKGALTNALCHFPRNMRFFSTPELLEIGDIPFIISGDKPTRTDALNYYRRVAQHYDLRLHLYEKVLRITKAADTFIVSSAAADYQAGSVVIATGYYDHPNLLNVPGEDLPKVSHYYTEPFPFFRRKVAVIGGKNSAVEAALDLYRHGAQVTLIHRGPEIRQSVKYWILPDILNRIQEGSIAARFNTRVVQITHDALLLQNQTGETETLANDFVFALTGYHPDYAFLQACGIEIIGGENCPRHDPATFETNVPGLYVAGVVAAGGNGNKIFIENGREHAGVIMRHLAGRLRNQARRAAVNELARV